MSDVNQNPQPLCRTAGLEGAGDPLLGEAGNLFKALSDPSRLRLLQVLLTAQRPLTQGELAKSAGLSVPNASKHLALLTREGLLLRHQLGTQVRFEPAQPMVTQVCSLVCTFILARSEASWRQLH